MFRDAIGTIFYDTAQGTPTGEAWGCTEEEEEEEEEKEVKTKWRSARAQDGPAKNQNGSTNRPGLGPFQKSRIDK